MSQVGWGGTLGVSEGMGLCVFLSAGEASGDHYGAEVIAEVARRVPGARFIGLGGTAMEAAGQQRVVRAEDVAHMGITEVLRHAPKVYAAYRSLVGALKRERPAVAVLIDFPDVNFRLAKHCRRMGIPVVWFVSPQLWAWKRGRLRWVQERVDRMMVIFPFEERFYKSRGVEAEFVGHPLAELAMPEGTREEYARVNGLDAAKGWVALLPGSRAKEVAENLPVMLDAARELGDGYEYVLPVASTLSRKQVLDGMKTDGVPLRLVEDARAALWHARVGVVASGTATVQALTVGNPFVVVYRVSGLTFWLAKQLVRYPEEIPAPVDAAGNLPIAMVNLVAGRRIVPELLNERFTAEGVAEALRPLLGKTAERARMVEDLREARARLRLEGGKRPVERVAEAVVGLMGEAGVSL